MRNTLLIVTLLAISACTSTPPFAWQDHVIPMENGEYVTRAQSVDKDEAANIATKAIWQACGDQKPEVLERNISHNGLMGETSSAVYETARNAAAVLGSWTPSINDSRYTAAFRFKCSES